MRGVLLYVALKPITSGTHHIYATAMQLYVGDWTLYNVNTPIEVT